MPHKESIFGLVAVAGRAQGVTIRQLTPFLQSTLLVEHLVASATRGPPCPSQKWSHPAPAVPGACKCTCRRIPFILTNRADFLPRSVPTLCPYKARKTQRTASNCRKSSRPPILPGQYLHILNHQLHLHRSCQPCHHHCGKCWNDLLPSLLFHISERRTGQLRTFKGVHSPIKLRPNKQW